jgi:hypothetical protein
MPTLTDPRAEAFAQSRARGAHLEDAYELAGFAGGQGHASRFAKRPKVAARVRELIEAGRRQPITGQDIAFELQRMVQHFSDFDTPQRMRETRETLLELRKMQVELEHQRAIERERQRRTSPQTARTSPKPPVSARVTSPAEREALAAPRRPALEFAASPLAIGAGTLGGGVDSLPRPSLAPRLSSAPASRTSEQASRR